MKIRLAVVGVFLLTLSWITGVQAAKVSHSPPSGCPPPLEIPSVEQLERARDQARNRGFLWRIFRGGRVSYLYGSLHVGKLEWAFPGPAVVNALQGTDTLALELDLHDPEVLASIQREFLARPARVNLEENLSRRLQYQIDIACISEDSKQSLAEAYSPEMAVTTLTLMSARSSGLESAFAAELAIAVWARQHKKKVLSLESPAFQVELLHAPTEEAMAEALHRNLSSLENRSAQRRVRHLAQLWATSRFDDLMRYPDWCECMHTPLQRAQMKRLLDDRNMNIAAKIDQLHQGGKRVFVLLGSLHMAGPRGLPALMLERGYRVERVEFAPGQVYPSGASVSRLR